MDVRDEDLTTAPLCGPAIIVRWGIFGALLALSLKVALLAARPKGT